MKYKIQADYIYGWDDTETDGDGNPVCYDSYEEADAEIDEFIKHAPKNMGYVREDFRVEEVK